MSLKVESGVKLGSVFCKIQNGLETLSKSEFQLLG